MTCTIGITCAWEEKNSCHKLHDEYVYAVKEAGGVPFLLPGLDFFELIAVYYNQLDGFIFSGGSDVDPAFFGEEPQQGLREITPRRDALELALAKLVLEGDKPALGICRGMQVLNIAAGGDVYQDLQDVTKQKHIQQAPRRYPFHTVQVQQDSNLFRLVQQESFKVNSFHHQAIRQVGKGLKAVGWSKDGLVEAIESSDARIMAVQWHPECNWWRDKLSFSLFENLVDYIIQKRG